MWPSSGQILPGGDGSDAEGRAIPTEWDSGVWSGVEPFEEDGCMEAWVTGRRQRLSVLGDRVPSKKSEYPRPSFGKRKGASATKQWRGSETREGSLAPTCRGGRTSPPVSLFGDGDGSPGLLSQSTTNQVAPNNGTFSSHCSGGRNRCVCGAALCLSSTLFSWRLVLLAIVGL